MRSTPRDSNAVQIQGTWDVQCHDKDGNLLWTDKVENAVYDEGEFAILDIAFRAGTAPANWYFGLLRNSLAAAPAETATLAAGAGNIAVPTNEAINATEAGYARILVERSNTGWPTLALSGGDYQLTSKSVVWTASGNWPTPIRWLFVTTIATSQDTTGKLISLAQLSADRTLGNGDTLTVTYSLKLQ